MLRRHPYLPLPRPRPRSVPGWSRVEPLEVRRLMHTLPDGSDAHEFAAKINFQPGGAMVPAGYVADAGHVFGDRGSGLSFGWDIDNRSSARDRGVAT